MNSRTITDFQKISLLKQPKTILLTNGNYDSAEKWTDPINLAFLVEGPVGNVNKAFGNIVFSIKY